MDTICRKGLGGFGDGDGGDDADMANDEDEGYAHASPSTPGLPPAHTPVAQELAAFLQNRSPNMTGSLLYFRTTSFTDFSLCWGQIKNVIAYEFFLTEHR